METTQDKSLYDYDPDAQPDAEKTLTIVHVDEGADVYGGRHSFGRQMGEAQPGMEKGWLGNPYRVANHGRDEAISKFRGAFLDELREKFHFTNAVLSLEGRTVSCHCRRSDEDEPACHLDVVREALLDGIPHRIAHDIHGIPLSDAEEDRMADPEEVL